MSAPPVAVTLGDPRGIGPEVVEKALAIVTGAGGEIDPEEVVVLGPEGMAPPVGRYRAVGEWDGSASSAGALAGEAVRAAAGLAREGRVRAVVTGPLHKPSFRAGGWDFPGQTEMLAELAGVGEVGMLMSAERTRIGGPLRILLATTHLPLREVASRITTPLLVGQVRLLHRALEEGWGIGSPGIAVCALNPHASDGGLFGDEEERIFAPALAELREAGIDASGPIPADTVFHRALEGEFDAVVAPYHDVGMAAFKTASFGTGVNVTLGLPFVRTSPDHGTALGIAGEGIADPASTVEAIRLALRLAESRLPGEAEA